MQEGCGSMKEAKQTATEGERRRSFPLTEENPALTAMLSLVWDTRLTLTVFSCGKVGGCGLIQRYAAGFWANGFPDADHTDDSKPAAAHSAGYRRACMAAPEGTVGANCAASAGAGVSGVGDWETDADGYLEGI